MDITAKGYVSNGETKVSKAGASYNKFTVGVKQKQKAYGDKPEVITWANLQVTDMSGGPLPPAKAYVTIEGRLTARDFEQNGVKRTALEVFTKSVSVAPPFENGASTGSSVAAPKAASKEPWDD